jgi:signal transduction histidine kinase
LLLNALTVLHEVLDSGKSLRQDWSPLGGGLLSAIFGIGFAVWITRIIHQSAERRRLIEQLQATRQELAVAEREAGRLAERGRLSREIHDTLAQGMISIVLLLEATEDALPAGSFKARRYLEQALRTARENLGEARHLVWELRPESLATAPLGEALRRLAQRLGEETGISATATVTGRPGSCPPTPRWRCCGSPRRRSPTCASTRAPRGSRSPSPTWRTRRSWTCATTAPASTAPAPAPAAATGCG